MKQIENFSITELEKEYEISKSEKNSHPIPIKKIKYFLIKH